MTKPAAAQGQVNVGEHGRLQPLYSGELPMQATGNSQQADRNPAPVAAYIYMQGRTLEVVSQSLITSYHFKTGNPYQFIACSVRDEKGKP